MGEGARIRVQSSKAVMNQRGILPLGVPSVGGTVTELFSTALPLLAATSDGCWPALTFAVSPCMPQEGPGGPERPERPAMLQEEPGCPMRGLRGLMKGLRGLRYPMRGLRGLRCLMKGLRGLRCLMRGLRGLRCLMRGLKGLLTALKDDYG